MNLEYDWKANPAMDEMIEGIPEPGNVSEAISSIGTRRKTGRNDPCPCRSGKKYKKCCLGK